MDDRRGAQAGWTRGAGRRTPASPLDSVDAALGDVGEAVDVDPVALDVETRTSSGPSPQMRLKTVRTYRARSPLPGCASTSSSAESELLGARPLGAHHADPLAVVSSSEMSPPGLAQRETRSRRRRSAAARRPLTRSTVAAAVSMNDFVEPSTTTVMVGLGGHELVQDVALEDHVTV